ncbi:unnamed protein product [Prorocentrum cordatum]|uniref:CSD domain-containing protein n=1 Tax=Prorocentrum cordatum TaxID=2364126 RepID=A0ABN9XVZ3_9DINO|nr:unnamed protein product [Polarella glacialis]
MLRPAGAGACPDVAAGQPADAAVGSAAQDVPQCRLAPLDQLVAEFRSRVGAAAPPRCDGEWELPSDASSDSEDRGAQSRSAGRALRPLGDLRRDFDARRAGAGAVPTTSPLPAAAAHRAVRSGQCGGAAAASTGTLVKVVQHKGFGFILPDGAEVADVLLHCSQLARDGLLGMRVGVRVRYVEETDARTGKKRAKEAAAMIGEEGPGGSTNGELRSRAAGASYSRDDLLRAFERIGRPSNGSSRCMFTTVRIPQGPCWAPFKHHGSLDDEYLIGKLEERLSKESGFDDMNEETFGESSGWSFEEAVAANAKLAVSLPFGLGAAAVTAAEMAEKHCFFTLADSTTGSGSSATGCSPSGPSPGESPSGSPLLRAARGEGAVALHALAGLQLQ